MGFNRLELLPRLLPAYRNILSRIAALGVQWVQMDEPCLAFELEAIWLEKLSEVYTTLHGSGCQLLLTTYFDAIDKHAATLKALPVEYLHIDVCRAPHQLDAFLSDYPTNKVLSLGIIDGRNVWRADLSQAFATLSKAQSLLGERLWIAPSCSLLHCLVDLQLETRLEGEIKGWLAFSVQKLNEIVILGRGLNQGKASIQTFLQESVEVR